MWLAGLKNFSYVEGKGKVFPVHAMKAYRGSRLVTPFLTSALDGSEWVGPHYQSEYVCCNGI